VPGDNEVPSIRHNRKASTVSGNPKCDTKKFGNRTKINMKRLTEINNEKSCGGKAINLAKLKSFGFHVKEAIIFEVEEVNHIINKQQVSQEVIDAIHAKLDFTDLGVAVRSSAVGEDSNLSWAGQFKSSLFINKDLLGATIIECANAIRSERVKAYAKLNNIDVPPLAIIVQEMVNPTVSGVTFTRNPVTKQNHIIIEMIKGVSDSLMNGFCSPMRYYFDFTTLHIINEEGNKMEEFITSQQIFNLASNAKKVHTCFGKPQDIEWAIEKYTNKIFLNQTRIITTV
jgi:phosphoenolpyruvate synthase/pyruvate phosphate dikinase